jgi:hypothetical protein
MARRRFGESAEQGRNIAVASAKEIHSGRNGNLITAARSFISPPLAKMVLGENASFKQ